jgi:MoxR-like ATPase
MHPTIEAITHAINQIILGKDKQVRLALTCLLARGHLLIEDLPGMGKTTLAHALAQVFGLDFNRVQFTSDLLPADVLGVSVYDRNASSFKFHQGPIFSNVLLADEINRATPKTQSALLEAMEEYQVSVDGDTLLLPKPFFVIATQNPKHNIGTFPLPESQLDRFLMRISLGYPDQASERLLLQKQGGRVVDNQIKTICNSETLLALQSAVEAIHVSGGILDYLQALIQYSRVQFDMGLSPRAGLGLKKCAQAWALCENRDYVIPEDIQAVLPSIATHRLHEETHANVAEKILQNVAI